MFIEHKLLLEPPRDLLSIAREHGRRTAAVVEADEGVRDHEPALGQVAAGCRKRHGRLESRHVVVREIADDGHAERFRLLHRDDARPGTDERMPSEPALLHRLEQEAGAAFAAQAEIGAERRQEVCRDLGRRHRHRLPAVAIPRLLDALLRAHGPTGHEHLAFDAVREGLGESPCRDGRDRQPRRAGRRRIGAAEARALRPPRRGRARGLAHRRRRLALRAHARSGAGGRRVRPAGRDPCCDGRRPGRDRAAVVRQGQDRVEQPLRGHRSAIRQGSSRSRGRGRSDGHARAAGRARRRPDRLAQPRQPCRRLRRARGLPPAGRGGDRGRRRRPRGARRSWSAGGIASASAGGRARARRHLRHRRPLR